jgi:hypothetical protein
MKRLIVLILLVIGLYLLWRWWQDRHPAEARGGERLFYDRVWIDHRPASDREEFQLLAAITQAPLGVFQRASVWRGSFERFRYEPAGDGRLTLLFPQSRERERVTYRAYACRENGFELCLDLTASRGVRRYFSGRGLELTGARGLEQAAALVWKAAAAP